MPPTGILHTEMDEDTLLELEIRQDLDRLNLDDDNVHLDNDDDDDNLDEVLPMLNEDVVAPEDEALPAELQNYVDAIQKQRRRFEEELEECDAIIDRAASTVAGEGGENDSAVVVYEDWKELEEEATRHGMTVEDYRKKLLKDIEDEPFELESMDFISSDADFILPETINLDKLLSKTPEEEEESEPPTTSQEATGMVLAKHPLGSEVEPTDDDVMIEKALKIARALEAEQKEKEGEEKRERAVGVEEGALAIMDSNLTDGGEERAETGQLVPVTKAGSEEDQESHSHQAPTSGDILLAVKETGEGEATAEGVDDSTTSSESAANKAADEALGVKALAVVPSNHLLEFGQYLREQFELAEERFRQREIQLKQELEARREVEEQLMLTSEQHKLHAMHSLQQEEQRLADKKQENQKKLDREIEKQQKVLEKELKKHEEAIAVLTTQLEEDRYQLEKVQRAEKERTAQRDANAATTIQRHYRGYRARQLHRAERQTMSEKKEQRKEEKTQHRVQEIELEIQQRKQEQQRKEEEARQAKEEEEREKEEEEKRKREEEERLKKEEEEKQKREEEERERKAEEERRRKEEEERQIKEEQERKKCEEEERRKEEEEKKRREEEERKQREEEEIKRKEEEDRTRREEEERTRKEEEAKKRKEQEEERRRKEEEERKRKEEEEERRKKEEERQKLEEEERKRREEERKRREEERKRREEEENGSESGGEQKPIIEAGPRSENGNNSQSASSGSVETPGGQERNYVNDQEGRLLPERENGHAVSGVVVDLEPVTANLLPDSLEQRRLAWMKSCLPWSKISNEPWKLKSSKGEKVPRRPASAKKLPPLPENLILEAAQVTSLRQVTTVELVDLPGHSLSPLGGCGQLKHLTVTRCGLIALDGLSQCKHLQCINAQDNLIEFVDLRELGGLFTLNLSHNKLSSVHGLEGCTNLRWMDLSHNRLTKLGGLSSLRRLHTLKVSHNQLVSVAGALELCPTLQRVDLSANYLTALPQPTMEKLPLLTSLDVASNNLTQMPSLENNVLLQELVLRENSIGPDLDLSVAWLPLLSVLDLSQNIIEDLRGSAVGLFVLKRLDLAVNQIAEMSGFLPALSECPRLEDLNLQGNAVLDEELFMNNVKNGIPSLVCLNGEPLRSQSQQQQQQQLQRSFDLLCLRQLQEHQDIKEAFEEDLRNEELTPSTKSHHVCDTYFAFCDRSFKAAVEHRYTHEYGELSSGSSPSLPSSSSTSLTNPLPHHTPRPPSSPALTPRASAHARNRALNLTAATNSGTKKEGSDQLSNDGNNASRVAGSTGFAPRSDGDKSNLATTDEKNVAEKSILPSSPELSQKEKFELALKSESRTMANSAESDEEARALLGNVGGISAFGQQRGREGWGEGDGGGRDVGGRGRKPLTEVSGDVIGRGRGEKREQQQQPEQLSAKEKFERALMGLPTTPSPLPPVTSTTHPPPPPSHHPVSGQWGGGGVSADDQLLGTNGSIVAGKRQQQYGTTVVTADRVGDLMMNESSAALPRSGLPSKLLDDDDDDLDDLEELMEGLQFDIDGFIDLDQFDFDEDFLEKGWRPEDTPQMPQKIHSSSSSKPPLPPVHHPHHPPPPQLPGGRPAHAWRSVDAPSPPAVSDLQSRVPPIRPPSSVGSGEDSQAMTTGGRSRKEDRLAEEWGFKDSRTAELMMQRANKMKYNAERRKKLSKLDPQQRLRLFRKLEEVKGVRNVRPTPPRVLPRKEYFQARHEEAVQRDMERQTEFRTKAGRTFEWLHTQVGDYDVSSSRINPGGAGKQLVKTASDTQLSHHPSPSPHGYSPVSMDIESASSYGSHSQQQAGRQHRHSLPGEELALSGQSPLLPPIKVSSASSQNSREREKMSWRTEPTEKNVGWGGGKKRLVRK